MIAGAYTIVFLFRQNAILHDRIDSMYETEMSRRDEETKFWKDAFITTSKYNKYLLIKDTTNEKAHRDDAIH